MTTEERLQRQGQASASRIENLIVIGASAGGHLALVEIFKSLAANIPAAIVILLRMSLDSPLRLRESLGRFSRLPIITVEDQEPLQQGFIFVPIPGRSATFSDGMITVERRIPDWPAKDNLGVNAPPDAGFLADQLLARLDQRGYHVIRAHDPAQFLRFRRRLSIPEGFTASVLTGKPMKISFDRTGEDMSADYDRVRLYRAVYATLADLMVVSGEKPKASKEAFEKLAAEPRRLTLDVKAAGKRLDPPSGFEQSVPGTMVMFTLLVLFTTGGVSLTMERNQGILRRLAFVAHVARLGCAGKMGCADVARSRPDCICDDRGERAVSRPLGPQPADGSARAPCVWIARRRARDVAGQLRSHRRPGDRTRSDGKQCLRRVGRLLVAHRDHAALDTKARAGVSHGLGDGCSAQAHELRRIARKRSPAFVCDRCSSAAAGYVLARSFRFQ